MAVRCGVWEVEGGECFMAVGRVWVKGKGPTTFAAISLSYPVHALHTYKVLGGYIIVTRPPPLNFPTAVCLLECGEGSGKDS